MIRKGTHKSPSWARNNIFFFRLSASVTSNSEALGGGERERVSHACLLQQNSEESAFCRLFKIMHFASPPLSHMSLNAKAVLCVWERKLHFGPKKGGKLSAVRWQEASCHCKWEERRPPPQPLHFSPSLAKAIGSEHCCLDGARRKEEKRKTMIMHPRRRFHQTSLFGVPLNVIFRRAKPPPVTLYPPFFSFIQSRWCE